MGNQSTIIDGGGCHPLQSGRPASSLKTEQMADLAHFLHQKVYNTLRRGPELQIQNVLTGDPVRRRMPPASS